MNKAYSNKALPAGTILREWRLEEVLGVGGFGIVYKGRGIYFDELVAIKEYFPSAISDRKDGDTVVPIDSDAEEVHALGLKKFVEEAKLLWNLSTPSRHPNIVSVRSLFEIHGTAYMVMDFEDGLSLSKLLKQGKRYNEASLLALLRPIAEGLERAHRVGVLHRDIKPPNILISEDGHPVLIDFGSARFESADATSTKVTFHTPPYAAIEQYVKTFEQGPWTDIYALGVVLYECIMGEKPPEVLERMHGGLGKPLAEQGVPGFSKVVLKAIDAAMAVRTDERPQSISQWLAMFDEPETEAESSSPVRIEEDEDATQIAVFDTSADKIVPIAPPPKGFAKVDKVETPVPDDTNMVRFKRAGEDTSAERTLAELPVEAEPDPQPSESVQDEGTKPPPPKQSETETDETDRKNSDGASGRTRLIAATAVAAILLVGGWFAMDKMIGASSVDTELTNLEFEGEPDKTQPKLNIDGVEGLAEAVEALANDARKAGAASSSVDALFAEHKKLAKLYSSFEAAVENPEQAAAARQAEAELKAVTRSAAVQFASDLQSDVERRSVRIARSLPWANPARSNSANGETAARQRIASRLLQAKAGVEKAAQTVADSSDPSEALASARQALSAWQSFVGGQGLAANAGNAQTSEDATIASVESEPVIEAASESNAVDTNSDPAKGVSPGKSNQLAAIVSSSRDLASRVIRMGNVSKPKSDAPDDEQDNYRILKQNTKTAEDYVAYLDILTNSMRGAKNDSEADRLITQARQTKSYLMTLLSRSTSASK